MHRKALQEAAKLLPYRIGEWIGSDVQAPAPAVSPLGEILIENRRYENFTTGWRASALLIYCKDSNDLAGYRPGILYRAGGWREISTRPGNLEIGDRAVPCTVHRFGFEGAGLRSCFVIEYAVGGVEIQVEMADCVPVKEQDKIFCTLMEAILPAVMTMEN